LEKNRTKIVKRRRGGVKVIEGDHQYLINNFCFRYNGYKIFELIGV
jgi:hypothetical protein